MKEGEEEEDKEALRARGAEREEKGACSLHGWRHS